MLINNLRRHYAKLQEDGLEEFLELIAKLYAFLFLVANVFTVLFSLVDGTGWNTIAFRNLMVSGTMALAYIALRFLLVTLAFLVYAWVDMVEDRQRRENLTFKEIVSQELDFDRGRRH